MIRLLGICLLFISHALFAADLAIDEHFQRLDFTTPLATSIDTNGHNAEHMLEFARFDTNLYQQSLSPNIDSYWYRIDLSAVRLSEQKSLSLVFQNHLLQHLDIYLFRQGELLKTAQLGISDRPFTDDVYEGMVFKFPIGVSERLTLLIRKQSDGPAIMPMSLMDEHASNKHQVNTLFLWGGAIGVFIALAAYNGFIYSMNRHSSQFGWYMLFQLFMFLNFAPLYGFGYLILPDSLCRWLGSHMGVSHLILLWCALMFGYHFLDIKSFRPKLARLIEKSVWLFLVLLIISFLLTELQRMYVTSVLIVVVSVICIGTAISALRNHYSPASFYLLSWLCTWIGAFCGFLTYSNILPQNIITLHSFMIGIFVELFLLSVSLAKRLQYQEQQEEEHRLIDHTLNMPNQVFYQYVLTDQFVERGFNKKQIKLILIHVEGADHLISALGTEIVASETRDLLTKIASRVSELPWQVDLCLNKDYFGVCIAPHQTLVFVTDDETTEHQVEVLLNIWQEQLASSQYLSDLHLRAASAGISHEGEEITDLHQKAYMALLEAQNGGLRWLPFKDRMTAKAETHVKLLHELKLAVSRRELDVYIQPQINLETNGVVGGEALMRWSHPSLGMISPGEFIPIAEQGGMIHALTRIAFEKVFAWLSLREKAINISINVSVLDLRQKDFIEFLHLISREYSVEPSSITLEITESQELDSSYDFVNSVNTLKKMGFIISIDDFGTGYSSMAYLSQLNIDEVKIDMIFVKDIQDNTTNQTIVKTLLNMADTLGAQSVIEGIETADELEMVKKLGGDLGQGYHWSPAIPVDEFEERFLD